MARPRLIDRDAVLAASLEQADDAGLESVTMAAVARRLGVTPMALYRHVEDKDDLLDGVVERLLTEIPPVDPAASWEHQLGAIGDSLRAIARRHPSVFPLLLQLPATTPASRAARDQVYGALRAAGVQEEAVPRLERVISTMVLGFAASEAAGRFRQHSRRVLDEDYAELTMSVRATIERHVTD
jgi:AcrR family transcriptional regulator